MIALLKTTPVVFAKFVAIDPLVNAMLLTILVVAFVNVKTVFVVLFIAFVNDVADVCEAVFIAFVAACVPSIATFPTDSVKVVPKPPNGVPA